MRRVALVVAALSLLALPVTSAAAHGRRLSPLSEGTATRVAERHAQEEGEGIFHWEVVEHSSICFREGRYTFKCQMIDTLNAGYAGPGEVTHVLVKASLLVRKTSARFVETALLLDWTVLTVGVAPESE
jgi:hypothetical protein